MEQNFEQYLTEMKDKNLYSNEVESNFLNELSLNTRFDPFKTDKKARPCISVAIDFTSEKFINNAAEQIKDLKGDEAKTKEAITNKICDYIAKINDAFRATSGHLFVRGSDNGTLKYYFKMYSKTDPEGNANDFKSRIDQELELSFIKNNMIVKDDTYSRIEKINLEKKPNELNPAENATETTIKENLANSVFVKNVVEKISGTIKERIEKANNLAKNGELKQVYCVPFKISETLINANKDKSDNIDTFWDNLVNEINNGFKNALENLGDNISSYIGFVPIKTHGLNIYFTDMDAAEQFAEQLTQEGTPNVSGRKRYEKKIAAYPQLLQDNNETIAGRELAGIEHAVLYFKSTLFAREKIASLIKEKFPNADDMIVVKRYAVKLPKEIINDILKAKQGGDLDVNTCYTNYIKKLIEPFLKAEEFIGAGSEKDEIEFIFTRKASTDKVKEALTNELHINRDDIKVNDLSLTQKEIEESSKSIRDDSAAAKNFKSLIDEITGNDEHDKIELNTLEIQLTNEQKSKLVDTIKANSGNVQKVISNFATELDKVLKAKVNSYITFNCLEDYKVRVYFKDSAGIDQAKEVFASSKMFTVGESGTTTVTNTDFKKFKNVHNTDGLEKSIGKTNADNAEAAANKKYTYTIKKSKEYDGLSIKDFATALKSLPESLNESFKTTLFNYLLKTTNIINEVTQKEVNDAKTWLETNKDSNDHINTNANILLQIKINGLFNGIKSEINDTDIFEYKSAEKEENDNIGYITVAGKFVDKLKTVFGKLNASHLVVVVKAQ